MDFKTKIEKAAEERNSRIVLALDLPPEKPYEILLSKAIKIMDETNDYVCAVKINRQLVLPLGLFRGLQTVLRVAKDYKLPLIMDCKINDVGHTNEIIARYYFEAGFDAVTANPFVGWEEGLKPVFKLARENGKGVIILVYMSHKSANEGYGQTVKDKKTGSLIPQYQIFARKAVEWNADGAVVGATYPEKIVEVKQIVKDKVPIYSPGVGFQGGKIKETIRAGANYLIVGRSITLAKNPAEAAKKIRDTVNSVLAGF